MRTSPQQGSAGRRPRWPALCLVAAAGLLLWSALLGDRALLPGAFLGHFAPWQAEGGRALEDTAGGHWNALAWDAVAQYYPWRAFAARTLAAGRLPLWNPHQFTGAPFLANAQSAVLYPPNLLFWLLPTWYAFGLAAFLHLLLAGGGMFLFLRALGVSRPGAAIGGLAFMLCGFFVTWLEMAPVIAAAAWLPLAWWGVERFWQRPAARWVLLTGGCLGMSVLAGHPQLAFYVLLGTVVFAAYRAAAAGRQLGWRPALGLAAAAGSGALAVAGLLAAGQVLPTAEYVRMSHRSPGGYDAYVRYALAWPQAIGCLLPDFFGRHSLGTYWGRGNYAEFVSYVGVVPLLLAACAARWRRPHAWFFLGLAGVAMLAALGTVVNLPLYHLVPGLKGSGGPARMLYLWAAALAALAGLGYDALADRLAAGKPARPWLFPLGLWAAAGLAVLLVWQLTPELLRLSLPVLLGDAWRNVAALVAVGLAFAVALVLARRRPALLGPLLAVLVAGDLLAFAQGYHEMSGPRTLYPRTPTIERVLEGGHRLAGLYRRWPLTDFPVAALPPNAAMVYGADDALGYDSIYPARYRELLAIAQGGHNPSPPANGNMLLAGRLDPALAALLDVEWLVAPPGVTPGPPWQETDIPHLYRLAARPGREALPRAPEGHPSVGQELAPAPQLAPARLWWTPRPATATGPAEAARQLAAAPAVPVVIGPDPAAGTPARPLAGEITRPTPNRLRVRFGSPGEGWLMLSEGAAPGWHATLNGRPVELRPTDLALRGLAVPPGPADLEMEYRPQTVRLGLFLTLAGVALLAGGAGWLVGRRETRHG